MNAFPKKVLVIRFSSIGDIVLCSAVLRCIKKQWKSEVHFITKESMKFVVSESPFVDKIITIQSKVSEVKDELRKSGYDLVIDLHKNIRSAQVKRIVKCKSTTFDKLNIEKWVTTHTPWNLLSGKHLVDRYFDSLKTVGLHNDGLGLDHFYANADEDKATQIVNDTYVVFSLGATYETKRLPLEKWLRYSQYITHKIVLVGGKDVVPLAEKITSHSKQEIINTCGKVSLGVSSALVKNSLYTLTGDSGMMHIAAAHNTPLIVHWGSTHPILGMTPYYTKEQEVPYISMSQDLSCKPCSKIGKDRCPKGHFDCMNSITDVQIENSIIEMERKINKRSTSKL